MSLLVWFDCPNQTFQRIDQFFDMSTKFSIKHHKHPQNTHTQKIKEGGR